MGARFSLESLLRNTPLCAPSNSHSSLCSRSLETRQVVAPGSIQVPQYVLDHAPVLWLAKNEQYFPSDLASHIANTFPAADYVANIPYPRDLSLSNLDTLDDYNGTFSGSRIYLTSNDGIRSLGGWADGTVPAADKSTPSTTASVIITVAKPNSVLDAFYFSFYAYDKGNWVFENPNLEFGNHVGDWEHTMIRFNSSTGHPQAMWFSQHASGQAFEFSAVEKHVQNRHQRHQPPRPVVYVARGTHANYASPGDQDHVIPGFPHKFGPLLDHTSRGTLWDPVLNSYIYSCDLGSGEFTAYNGVDPVGFLHFKGRWGDKELPDSAKGQVDFFGQKKYASGPTGPKDKRLSRKNVCPKDEEFCLLRSWLADKRVSDMQGTRN